MNVSNLCRRFPRSARVCKSAEYAVVFACARRHSEPLLSLHWHMRETPPRLGIAVSRKVSSSAVERNRIKRVIRESMRYLLANLANGDYVVVARPAAAKASNIRIHEAFLRLLRRAGTLPTSAEARLFSYHLTESDSHSC